MQIRSFGPPLQSIYNGCQGELAVAFMETELSDAEVFLWQAFLPERVPVRELDRITVPAHIKKEAYSISASGIFDAIEVWCSRGALSDPLLVYRLGNRWYIRYQWGESKLLNSCQVGRRIAAQVVRTFWSASLLGKLSFVLAMCAFGMIVSFMTTSGILCGAVAGLAFAASREYAFERPRALATLDAYARIRNTN